MSNINMRQEPYRNDIDRNEAAKNQPSSNKRVDSQDEDDFNKAMKTASKAEYEETESEPTDGEAENLSLIDASKLTSVTLARPMASDNMLSDMLSGTAGLASESSQDQSIYGIGLSINGPAIAPPGSLAAVDLTTSPLNIEQLSKMMEQITQQTSQAGNQWKFMLLENSALKQISLHQVTPGRWTIALESTDKTQDQLLSNNLDKLILRLRENGTNVDLVQMQELA